MSTLHTLLQQYPYYSLSIPATPKGIPALYSYQSELLSYTNHHTDVIVTLPTGMGKTRLASELALTLTRNDHESTLLNQMLSQHPKIINAWLVLHHRSMTELMSFFSPSCPPPFSLSPSSHLPPPHIRRVLFLAPTRVLAAQQADMLRNETGLRTLLLTESFSNNADMKRAAAFLSLQASGIIVSSPGTIETYMNHHAFSLTDFSLVVFDECHVCRSSGHLYSSLLQSVHTAKRQFTNSALTTVLASVCVSSSFRPIAQLFAQYQFLDVIKSYAHDCASKSSAPTRPGAQTSSDSATLSLTARHSAVMESIFYQTPSIRYNYAYAQLSTISSTTASSSYLDSILFAFTPLDLLRITGNLIRSNMITPTQFISLVAALQTVNTFLCYLTAMVFDPFYTRQFSHIASALQRITYDVSKANASLTQLIESTNNPSTLASIVTKTTTPEYLYNISIPAAPKVPASRPFLISRLSFVYVLEGIFAAQEYSATSQTSVPTTPQQTTDISNSNMSVVNTTNNSNISFLRKIATVGTYYAYIISYLYHIHPRFFVSQQDEQRRRLEQQKHLANQRRRPPTIQEDEDDDDDDNDTNDKFATIRDNSELQTTSKHKKTSKALHSTTSSSILTSLLSLLITSSLPPSILHLYIPRLLGLTATAWTLPISQIDSQDKVLVLDVLRQIRSLQATFHAPLVTVTSLFHLPLVYVPYLPNATFLSSTQIFDSRWPVRFPAIQPSNTSTVEQLQYIADQNKSSGLALLNNDENLTQLSQMVDGDDNANVTPEALAAALLTAANSPGTTIKLNARSQPTHDIYLQTHRLQRLLSVLAGLQQQFLLVTQYYFHGVIFHAVYSLYIKSFPITALCWRAGLRAKKGRQSATAVAASSPMDAFFELHAQVVLPSLLPRLLDHSPWYASLRLHYTEGTFINANNLGAHPYFFSWAESFFPPNTSQRAPLPIHYSSAKSTVNAALSITARSSVLSAPASAVPSVQSNGLIPATSPQSYVPFLLVAPDTAAQHAFDDIIARSHVCSETEVSSAAASPTPPVIAPTDDDLEDMWGNAEDDFATLEAKPTLAVPSAGLQEQPSAATDKEALHSSISRALRALLPSALDNLSGLWIHSESMKTVCQPQQPTVQQQHQQEATNVVEECIRLDFTPQDRGHFYSHMQQYATHIFDCLNARLDSNAAQQHKSSKNSPLAVTDHLIDNAHDVAYSLNKSGEDINVVHPLGAHFDFTAYLCKMGYLSINNEDNDQHDNMSDASTSIIQPNALCSPFFGELNSLISSSLQNTVILRAPNNEQIPTQRTPSPLQFASLLQWIKDQSTGAAISTDSFPIDCSTTAHVNTSSLNNKSLVSSVAPQSLAVTPFIQLFGQLVSAHLRSFTTKNTSHPATSSSTSSPLPSVSFLSSDLLAPPTPKGIIFVQRRDDCLALVDLLRSLQCVDHNYSVMYGCNSPAMNTEAQYFDPSRRLSCCRNHENSCVCTSNGTIASQQPLMAHIDLSCSMCLLISQYRAAFITSASTPLTNSTAVASTDDLDVFRSRGGVGGAPQQQNVSTYPQSAGPGGVSNSSLFPILPVYLKYSTNLPRYVYSSPSTVHMHAAPYVSFVSSRLGFSTIDSATASSLTSRHLYLSRLDLAEYISSSSYAAINNHARHNNNNNSSNKTGSESTPRLANISDVASQVSGPVMTSHQLSVVPSSIFPTIPSTVAPTTTSNRSPDYLTPVFSPGDLPWANTAKGKLTNNDFNLIVHAFSQSWFNLLISTTIAEEGLDITTCSFVVSYQPKHQTSQIIQSLGRARHVAVQYFSFTPIKLDISWETFLHHLDTATTTNTVPAGTSVGLQMHPIDRLEQDKRSALLIEQSLQPIMSTDTSAERYAASQQLQSGTYPGTCMLVSSKGHNGADKRNIRGVGVAQGMNIGDDLSDLFYGMYPVQSSVTDLVLEETSCPLLPPIASLIAKIPPTQLIGLHASQHFSVLENTRLVQDVEMTQKILPLQTESVTVSQMTNDSNHYSNHCEQTVSKSLVSSGYWQQILHDEYKYYQPCHWQHQSSHLSVLPASATPLSEAHLSFLPEVFNTMGEVLQFTSNTHTNQIVVSTVESGQIKSATIDMTNNIFPDEIKLERAQSATGSDDLQYLVDIHTPPNDDDGHDDDEIVSAMNDSVLMESTSHMGIDSRSYQSKFDHVQHKQGHSNTRSVISLQTETFSSKPRITSHVIGQQQPRSDNNNNNVSSTVIPSSAMSTAPSESPSVLQKKNSLTQVMFDLTQHIDLLAISTLKQSTKQAMQSHPFCVDDSVVQRITAKPQGTSVDITKLFELLLDINSSSSPTKPITESQSESTQSDVNNDKNDDTSETSSLSSSSTALTASSLHSSFQHFVNTRMLGVNSTIDQLNIPVFTAAIATTLFSGSDPHQALQLLRQYPEPLLYSLSRDSFPELWQSKIQAIVERFIHHSQQDNTTTVSIPSLTSDIINEIQAIAPWYRRDLVIQLQSQFAALKRNGVSPTSKTDIGSYLAALHEYTPIAPPVTSILLQSNAIDCNLAQISKCVLVFKLLDTNTVPVGLNSSLISVDTETQRKNLRNDLKLILTKFFASSFTFPDKPSSSGSSKRIEKTPEQSQVTNTANSDSSHFPVFSTFVEWVITRLGLILSASKQHGCNVDLAFHLDPAPFHYPTLSHNIFLNLQQLERPANLVMMYSVYPHASTTSPQQAVTFMTQWYVTFINHILNVRPITTVFPPVLIDALSQNLGLSLNDMLSPPIPLHAQPVTNPVVRQQAIQRLEQAISGFDVIYRKFVLPKASTKQGNQPQTNVLSFSQQQHNWPYLRAVLIIKYIILNAFVLLPDHIAHMIAKWAQNARLPEFRKLKQEYLSKMPLNRAVSAESLHYTELSDIIFHYDDHFVDKQSTFTVQCHFSLLLMISKVPSELLHSLFPSNDFNYTLEHGFPAQFLFQEVLPTSWRSSIHFAQKKIAQGALSLVILRTLQHAGYISLSYQPFVPSSFQF